MAAGTIAAALDGSAASRVSFHLTHLEQAGLIISRREGRSIIYRANLERVRALTLFLLKDCCGGRAELCAPLVAELAPCC